MRNHSIFLLFIFTSFSFYSCSTEGDDSEGENNLGDTYYYKFNIGDEEFLNESDEWFATSFGGSWGCPEEDSGLDWNWIGGPDTSKFETTARLGIDGSAESLESNVSRSTKIVGYGHDLREECFENLTFSFVLSRNNGEYYQQLEFNNSGENLHKITGVDFISESGGDDIYAISGTFEIDFIDVDGSKLKTQGDYRIPVYIMK